MSAPSMEKFVAKTRLQRQILNYVNRKFEGTRLDGLSGGAIERWTISDFSRIPAAEVLRNAVEFFADPYGKGDEDRKDIASLQARADEALCELGTLVA